MKLPGLNILTVLFRAVRRPLLRALLLLWVAWGAVACGQPKALEELDGTFGAGSGGSPVNPGAVVTLPLTSGGSALGGLSYDGAYFFQIPTSDESVVLSDSSGSVMLIVAPISGRADTPCRFQAALLARDRGYALLAAGDRKNAQGLEFHEVDLGPGADFQRFYCTELKSHLGILINGVSNSGNNLGTEQVHFVLNSVQP
ncbi:MAG: hypothetical protein OEW39_07045 [Deltaproteobacteria bacterium]|nr:hypothetical protein [Deltaproteobacteria bacterium]